MHDHGPKSLNAHEQNYRPVERLLENEVVNSEHMFDMRYSEVSTFIVDKEATFEWSDSRSHLHPATSPASSIAITASGVCSLE